MCSRSGMFWMANAQSRFHGSPKRAAVTSSNFNDDKIVTMAYGILSMCLLKKPPISRVGPALL